MNLSHLQDYTTFKKWPGIGGFRRFYKLTVTVIKRKPLYNKCKMKLVHNDHLKLGFSLLYNSSYLEELIFPLINK